MARIGWEIRRGGDIFMGELKYLKWGRLLPVRVNKQVSQYRLL